MLIRVTLLWFVALSLQANEFCSTEAPQISVGELELISDRTDTGERNLWSEQDRHQLTFCIDDGFKDLKGKMTEAMLLAVEDWQRYANVTFTYKPEHDGECQRYNPQVLFRVKIVNARRTPFSARAFFPYAEDKKRVVLFKKKIVQGEFPTLLRIAKHEIGHVLGFRHEHIHPNSVKECKEDQNFDPLTDYDQNSIMHYITCGGTKSDSALSELDKQGAMAAYP